MPKVLSAAPGSDVTTDATELSTTASEISVSDASDEDSTSLREYNSCFYVPPTPKNVMRVYHNRKKTAYTDYPIDHGSVGPTMTLIQLLAIESNPTRGQVSKVAYAEGEATEESNLFQVLETPDVRGWVPLQIATRQRQTEAVAALLSLGANPDCRDPDTGCTPLIVAVTNGDTQIVKHLIESGADVNVFSGLENRNAFCEAVFARRADIIDILIAAGARMDLIRESYPEVEQAYRQYHLSTANRLCNSAWMAPYWSTLLGLRWHEVMPATMTVR
jgi:ankyrin repeat protein